MVCHGMTDCVLASDLYESVCFPVPPLCTADMSKVAANMTELVAQHIRFRRIGGSRCQRRKNESFTNGKREGGSEFR